MLHTQLLKDSWTHFYELNDGYDGSQEIIAPHGDAYGNLFFSFKLCLNLEIESDKNRCIDRVIKKYNSLHEVYTNPRSRIYDISSSIFFNGTVFKISLENSPLGHRLIIILSLFSDGVITTIGSLFLSTTINSGKCM